jgi:hypothetical protein
MKLTEIVKIVMNEYSYNGKYEGDLIRVGSFSKRKLPTPVLTNVLKTISQKVYGTATKAKYLNGEYNDIEIKLFGQLISALNGTY